MFANFIAKAIVAPMVEAMLPTIARIVQASVDKFLEELVDELPGIIEGAVKGVVPDQLDRHFDDLDKLVRTVLEGRLAELPKTVLDTISNLVVPFKGFLK